jgi:hypothetical protein
MHFDKLILKSTNNIATMNIKKTLSSNPLDVANTFNAYFFFFLENLIIKYLFGKNSTNNNDPLTYLRQNFSQSISAIRLNNSTMQEIDKIIHSLKCKDLYGYDEISTRI